MGFLCTICIYIKQVVNEKKRTSNRLIFPYKVCFVVYCFIMGLFIG